MPGYIGRPASSSTLAVGYLDEAIFFQWRCRWIEGFISHVESKRDLYGIAVAGCDKIFWRRRSRVFKRWGVRDAAALSFADAVDDSTAPSFASVSHPPAF